MMNKKGELTTQQIVVLVIAIVSFAVILFLIVRLNLGETTSEELCHNSVLTRGSAVVGTNAISLDCHRKYKCITTDGNCEGLTNPEILKVDSLPEVYEKLADEMATCWWMFGEGRVNYIGDDLTHNNYCSICSQILFDDSLKKFGDTISKDDLYDYLNKTKMDDTNTYAQYLFGGQNIEDLKAQALAGTGVGTLGNIEVGKQYFVVMGITSNVNPWKWAGWTSGGFAIVTAGAVGTFLTVSTPVGWVIGMAILGGTVGSAASGVADSRNPEIAAFTINGRGIDNKFMVPTIIEAESDKFKALNCENVLTLA